MVHDFRNSYSVVMNAAISDSNKHALVCLKAGPDPNSCDYDKRTVFHQMCLSGNLKAVEALLAVGANVNCTDRCAPLRWRTP
jgi:ankyrin repeat protein